ncbi:hypothetical protein FBD94_22400 [Pedobacter hiemivivus]|uniref:CDP-glycerol--glycerophosphate glycerophosphotransferase n=1 Tax=Pedobacter hiemivivus TaxID=2530454 RepID=A0A4U1G0I6_9SPHI|nr:hypothetical protein [Pedobacter hiemivivus]TKC56951.1 hypothetical protein FBD94_22400 [Pedobacter hiemivivus]
MMLDIYDINYEFCSEKLGNLNFPPDTLPKKGILLRILSLFKGIMKYNFRKDNGKLIEPNSTLFFVMAQNEINSVKPVITNVPNAVLFGLDNYKNGYPLGRIYFLSIFFIPVVFYRYFICSDLYHKRSYQYAFDGFCLAYASHIILKKYLNKIKPSAIIIANQLSCYHRCLAIVAKNLSINTIYIQHASVTENFSNLNVFSAALLEGEDSLVKYQRNGTINADLFLIGMPKFDQYFSMIKKNGKINSIGICTNGIDDLKSYDKLIEFFSLKLPNFKIILRPHPSDRRKEEWYQISRKYNCTFSDASKVESFKFFDDVNLIIAGDSNIHLEATLLNISCIYFDPLKSNVDWYGFALNKLVYYSTRIDEIHNHILRISDLSFNARQRAKYYVDTINTNFDGQSSKLAAKIIRKDFANIFFDIIIDDYGNKIYRIKQTK